MSLHGHGIVTQQGLEFTLEFMPGVVCSVGLDKYTMMFVLRHSLIPSYVTAPGDPLCPPPAPSPELPVTPNLCCLHALSLADCCRVGILF